MEVLFLSFSLSDEDDTIDEKHTI